MGIRYSLLMHCASWWNLKLSLFFFHHLNNLVENLITFIVNYIGVVFAFFSFISVLVKSDGPFSGPEMAPTFFCYTSYEYLLFDFSQSKVESTCHYLYDTILKQYYFGSLLLFWSIPLHPFTKTVLRMDISYFSWTSHPCRYSGVRLKCYAST